MTTNTAWSQGARHGGQCCACVFSVNLAAATSWDCPMAGQGMGGCALPPWTVAALSPPVWWHTCVWALEHAQDPVRLLPSRSVRPVHGPRLWGLHPTGRPAEQWIVTSVRLLRPVLSLGSHLPPKQPGDQVQSAAAASRWHTLGATKSPASPAPLRPPRRTPSAQSREPPGGFLLAPRS